MNSALLAAQRDVLVAEGQRDGLVAAHAAKDCVEDPMEVDRPVKAPRTSSNTIHMAGGPQTSARPSHGGRPSNPSPSGRGGRGAYGRGSQGRGMVDATLVAAESLPFLFLREHFGTHAE
eukprot:gene32513-17214_t